MDHAGVVLVMSYFDGLSDQNDPFSHKDIPLVSMVKDTDGSIVWYHGAQNKCDPGLFCKPPD